MRMIDHIRAAIEACDTIGERVDYVATRYDAKRDSIRRQINRELAKQRKTVDTGADDDRDAFTFDDDEYQFSLAGEKTFSVPSDQVQEWVRWYVSDGAGVTQRTITRMSWQIHGRPLTKDYARRIFRALGIDKSAPPFAPHLLAKYDADELTKMHFATAQADVEMRMRADEPRHWRANWVRAEKRAAELERQLADHEQLADELAKRINRRAPETVKALMVPESDTMLLVPVYDVHVGKRCLSGSNSEQALETAMLSLFGRVSVHRPERVELVFGGDFFHVDNERGTSAGTPQDMDADWVDIIHRGWECAERTIELWRKLGSHLVVRVVPGNHDRGACHHLAAGLSRHYRDTDVDVQVSRREMQATTYGQSLLVFEHGDGPKPKDMVAVVANKYPQEWGATRHRYVVTGHLHHTHEHDVGVTVLQQPSISGTDRWHDKNGYTTGKRGMRAYSFCPQMGMVATWTHNL